MALDEVLLAETRRLDKPVLRFYSWNEPAASFGYFQKYSEVERLTLLRPLVRRPTGGGLVPHNADWTYSLAFPPGDPWYELPATESYRRLHEWIGASFARLGVPTELAPETSKPAAGQCFVGHEKSDLLWQGKKIAGAAQRRTRAGLLVQGSVQTPLALSRDEWHQAMCAVAHAELGVTCLEMSLAATVHAEALRLAGQTYSQASYNRKR